jgi:hypothetical protein
MRLNIISTLLLLAYEGEETPEAKAAAEAARKAAEDEKNGKKFSQEDVNKIVAEEKRKTQAAQAKLVTELEAMRNKANLTASEREEIEQRLESVKSEFMTKEELLKQEKAKSEKKLKEELDTKSKEAENWRGRFTQSTITRSITDAAVASDAFSPKQIVAQLAPNTRLVDVLGEDNKPTGEFVAKVKITVKDKDSKDVTLDLPVDEAVKKMSEQDEFANLFKGKGTGGTGGQNRGGGKTPDLVTAAQGDPATYRRLRKEGKISL